MLPFRNTSYLKNLFFMLLFDDYKKECCELSCGYIKFACVGYE